MYSIVFEDFFYYCFCMDWILDVFDFEFILFSILFYFNLFEDVGLDVYVVIEQCKVK